MADLRKKITATGVSGIVPAGAFKPYVHPGDAEPPAVTAARERHRAINAEIERCAQASMDDAGPDPLEPAYEWYRELADTRGDDADAAAV
jgi:hypothetical protein